VVVGECGSEQIVQSKWYMEKMVFGQNGIWTKWCGKIINQSRFN